MFLRLEWAKAFLFDKSSKGIMIYVFRKLKGEKMKITLRAMHRCKLNDLLQVRLGGHMHTYDIVEIITSHLPNPAIKIKHQKNGDEEILIFNIKKNYLQNEQGVKLVKFMDNMAKFCPLKLTKQV